MKFMIIVKANKDSESGVMPTEKLLAAMAKYNEELANAGLLVDLNGLQPSSNGSRIKFSKGERIVTNGPFPNPTELIAGYWVIKAKSREEAIDWAKRAPFDIQPGDTELEIRQIFELEDFAPSDAIDQHAKLRDKLESR
ncbi:MAG TPA: YciI family protein [Blastocatellia bacterium]|nr:YciI family protein [Blastocatellia bacterium]